KGSQPCVSHKGTTSTTAAVANKGPWFANHGGIFGETKLSRPIATSTRPTSHENKKHDTAPATMKPIIVHRLNISRWKRPAKMTCATGGMIVSATMRDAISAKVLVYASGVKSLPSAPTIVNTGRKPTMVVDTAATTALPTSLVAR